VSGCDRCGDRGLVQLDRRVEYRNPHTDAITVTSVPYAYRCDCQAGARMSKAFALAPAEPRPTLRLLTRVDLDG